MVIKIYVFELKKNESFFNMVVIIRYDGIMIFTMHGNNDIDFPHILQRTSCAAKSNEVKVHTS